MNRCVIFCAALCEGAELLPGDFVIAADGGLAHCRRLGITPNEILGDFDSLGSIPQGASVFPVEKDDTDAMLAAKRGLCLGFREFLFYGSLDGPRLDHTVANFQMLMYLADHDAHGTLVGILQKVTLLRNGVLRFPAGMTGNISVFAMGGDAEGVTLRGLYYPLENGRLTTAFPLGVSNHFTGEAAEITVEKGNLLVIWDGDTN
ncbi:MAG: thiamine diphosphokinase [Candidatus Faecousia sp.]|nr:thiamine diphosphokinase [Clostridiales bacterium]MDY6180106.1 thiamine diphosphokinase [Candidatus Faecousia sp.]